MGPFQTLNGTASFLKKCTGAYVYELMSIRS